MSNQVQAHVRSAISGAILVAGVVPVPGLGELFTLVAAVSPIYLRLLGRALISREDNGLCTTSQRSPVSDCL